MQQGALWACSLYTGRKRVNLVLRGTLGAEASGAGIALGSDTGAGIALTGERSGLGLTTVRVSLSHWCGLCSDSNAGLGLTAA